MSDVMVVKLDLSRHEKWRYPGRLLKHGGTALLVEAHFNRDDLPFHGIVLGRGDRFVELFFTDRWYNIFEIHDRSDDHLKGWYCNVCMPAEWKTGQVSYVDLALDLLVYEDGRQLVLDEDEFDALLLEPQQRDQARAALTDLQNLFSEPFVMEDCCA